MSTANWSVDAKRALALYVTVNSLFGLWPLLEVDLRLKIRMTTGIVQMIFMLISTSYEMIQNCGDAEDSLDNLLVLTSAVICLSKLVAYSVHRDKLMLNVSSAIEDWSSTEAIEYRHIMTSYTRFYKRITFVLLTGVIWSCGLYFIKVLVLDPDEMIEDKRNGGPIENVTNLILKKRYLFPSTCTLNNVPETVHLVLISNQFVQMVTCGVVAVGTDGLFLAITTHLCGQFKILKTKFASIGIDTNRSITAVSREKVVVLISRHQHLLRLTELLEGAYNKVVLTQLFTSVTLISVAGFSFLIATKANDFFGSVKSLVLMQYMLMQSFMYTCVGEALQNQGDDLTQSIYDGSWYELPRYLTKDLVFVMMRSNVTPYLTAGKIFVMTRGTFMDVVKTSSSYLSVLRIILNE